MQVRNCLVRNYSRSAIDDRTKTSFLGYAAIRLAIADLSARVGRVPAALRVVVLDACRTDDTLRAKGMQEEPAFAVALPGSVTELPFRAAPSPADGPGDVVGIAAAFTTGVSLAVRTSDDFVRTSVPRSSHASSAKSQ